MPKPKSKSILSNKKKCFVCGKTGMLDVHHIYGGRNRSVSDANGFWVYLCRWCHTGGGHSIHNDPEHRLDNELKQACQTVYERTHTREEFMELVGRNYRDE